MCEVKAVVRGKEELGDELYLFTLFLPEENRTVTHLSFRGVRPNVGDSTKFIYPLDQKTAQEYRYETAHLWAKNF